MKARSREGHKEGTNNFVVRKKTIFVPFLPLFPPTPLARGREEMGEEITMVEPEVLAPIQRRKFEQYRAQVEHRAAQQVATRKQSHRTRRERHGKA